MYIHAADRELLNLARRIYFKGTREEKRNMPYPTIPPKDFINWAREEARSVDPQRRARWECINGKLPSGPPLEIEEVDPGRTSPLLQLQTEIWGRLQ